MVIRCYGICLSGIIAVVVVILGNINKIRYGVFLKSSSWLCSRTGYSCAAWYYCLFTVFSFNIDWFRFGNIWLLLLLTEEIICWFTIWISILSKHIHWVLLLLLLRYLHCWCMSRCIIIIIHECIYQWRLSELIRGFTVIMVNSKKRWLLFI